MLLFACKQRFQFLVLIGFRIARFQDDARDRGGMAVPERKVVLQPCDGLTVLHKTLSGSKSGEIFRRFACFRLNVVNVGLK